MSKQKWTTENIPDLSGKVIIVTGGNIGLGYESVKAFYEKGAEVILAFRSLEKGEKAKAEIEKEGANGKVVVMELDLANLESVRRFAEAQKATILDTEIEVVPGLIAGQKSIPCKAAGCYAPGGRYSHVASALTVTTAKVAGCGHITA